MKKLVKSIPVLALAAFFSCGDDGGGETLPVIEDVKVSGGIVTVTPIEYYKAFRNPLKGMREFFGPGYDARRAEYPYPFGSMIKEYMQWNMMESVATDGVDKVIAYSDHRWKGVEDINVKVIPRPYIVWIEPWEGGYAKNTYTDNPDDLNGWHWPSDIPGETYSPDPNTPITGGYFDPSFQERVEKLVAKLGEAWDDDPRVAYIEMGLIGEWGEHHDPNITTYWNPHLQPNHVANRTWIPGIEKTLGDAFRKAFKNKKVMIRYAYDFKDYEFGVYWDSWAIDEEDVRGYGEMKKLGDRWKTQVIGGEVTWNWGSLNKYPTLEKVLENDRDRKKIIDQIRELHGNHLGGVTWANFNDQTFFANVSNVQKALGYRFMINEFKYPVRIDSGEPFEVSFKVTNTGSSPFYYDWPVEIALIDVQTHEKVWGRTLDGVKISQWMPGDGWDGARYATPAPENPVTATLNVDVPLSAGKYAITIAILDPAGMLPSARFAVRNYFNGGRHPMGYVGVDGDIDTYAIKDQPFHDIQGDRSLKYTLSE